MSGIKGNHLGQGLWPMEQNSLFGKYSRFLLWPFFGGLYLHRKLRFYELPYLLPADNNNFYNQGKSVSVYLLQKAGITAGGVLS